MLKKTTVATGAVAGVLLFVQLPPTPAQAMPGLKLPELAAEGATEVRRRHFGGRRFRGGRHFRFRRFHGGRRFGFRRHFHGPRFHRRHFHFYPYYYGGYRGCRWLRWRAIVTGSPYWWRRYYICRHGWY